MLAIFTGAGFGKAAAQNDWAWKNFMQWDRTDVNQVLNDSPWVKKQEVRINRALARPVTVAGGPPGPDGAFLRGPSNTVNSSSPLAAVDFVFTLRLRSGLPIRAAQLRDKQLDAHYDKLTALERTAFDTKWSGILQCPACTDNYVLTLSSSSKEQPGADAIYSVFKGARLADLQRYVYIANEKGERRPLVHLVPPKVPGDEAVFFFARYDEKGAPLFNPKSRELLFNLTNNEVSLAVNFSIDVSRLLIDGQVSF
jgi:hypothetical protein